MQVLQTELGREGSISRGTEGEIRRKTKCAKFGVNRTVSISHNYNDPTLWRKKTPRMRITVTSSSNEISTYQLRERVLKRWGGGTLPSFILFYSRYLKTTWTVFPPPQTFPSWRKLRILGNWSTNILFLMRIIAGFIHTAGLHFNLREDLSRFCSYTMHTLQLLYFLHKKVLKSVKISSL